MLTTQHSFEVPYVEKYRPVTLDDVVGKIINIDLARQYGGCRLTEVYCQIWEYA